MNRKTLFVLTAVVLLGAFAAAVAWHKSEQTRAAGQALENNRTSLASTHSPRLGSLGARVHVVEFLDPACETCRQFYPYVKQMMADNPDRIRLSIRHLPLHPGSADVVRMLEASRKQDRYWQALEALFAAQPRWVVNHTANPEVAWTVIAGAGLDLERLRADMSAPDVLENIRKDGDDAKALNVTMTPEYFVNGRQLPSFGLQQLKDLVGDALRTAYR
jgi:protein-disulfide isomerase